MSEENKKIYVNMWPRTSKAGNTYLSGKRKDTNEFYYVFKDKNNESIRRVSKKDAADDNADFESVIDLNVRNTEKDGETITYFSNGNFTLSSNMFFFNEDGSTDMTDKEGNVVVDKEGNPKQNATHTLVIKPS